MPEVGAQGPSPITTDYVPSNTAATSNTSTTSNTTTTSSTSTSVTLDAPKSGQQGSSGASIDVLPAPQGDPAMTMLMVQSLNSKMASTQQGSAAETIASDQTREHTDMENFQKNMQKAANAAKHHAKGFHPFKSLGHVLKAGVKDIEKGAKDLNRVLEKVCPAIRDTEKAVTAVEHDVVHELDKTALGRDIVKGVEDVGKMAAAFANNPLQTLESLGKEAIGACLMAVGDEDQGAGLFMSGMIDQADIALCDSGVLHGKAEQVLNIDLKVASAVAMMAAGDPEEEVAEGGEDLANEGGNLASDGTSDAGGDAGDAGGDEDEMGGAYSGADDAGDISSSSDDNSMAEREQQESFEKSFEESEEQAIAKDAGDGSGDEDPEEAKAKDKDKSETRQNTRKLIKYTQRAVMVTQGAMQAYNGGVAIYNGHWAKEALDYQADAQTSQKDFTIDKEAMDTDINALKARMQQYGTITKDVTSILSNLEGAKTDTTQQGGYV